MRKGLYESFKVENPTGAKGSRVHLKITFSSEPFPVTYSDLLSEERCLSCFCCTPCASECGCDGRGEDEDGQVRRILGIDFNDERVVEAETARRKFVRESEAPPSRISSMAWWLWKPSTEALSMFLLEETQHFTTIPVVPSTEIIVVSSRNSMKNVAVLP